MLASTEVEYCRIVFDPVDRIFIARSTRYPGIQTHGKDAAGALAEMESVLASENLQGLDEDSFRQRGWWQE